MQRAIMRLILKKAIKKAGIAKPSKHISDAFRSFRGTKFVEIGRKVKNKYRGRHMVEIKLEEEEKTITFTKNKQNNKQKNKKKVGA